MKKNIVRTLEKQKKRKNINYQWIIKITGFAFLMSLVFSSMTSSVIPNIDNIFGIILILLFVLLGVMFDMIGLAVASSEVRPFHSMSAKRLKGSKVAVYLIKNAEKVSSFCNDVVGDVSGIISGSTGIIIASNIAESYHLDKVLVTLIITAIIASLTIGGKALGKSYAINKSNLILYEVSKFIAIFYEPKK